MFLYSRDPTSGPNVLKLFIAVIYGCSYTLEPFHPSLMFAGNAEALYQ